MLNKLLLTIFSLCLCVHAFATWQPENFLKLAAIKSVTVADDGKTVAFVAARISKLNWIYELYCRKADNQVVKLTSSNKKILATQWVNHDQTIAFLAQGKNNSAIFTVDLKTNKIALFFATTKDIQAFKITANNKLLAFVATDLTQAPAKTTDLIDVATNYINTRLFLVDLTKHSKKPIPISPAEKSIAMVGNNGFDFAPDAKSLVYAYQPHAGIFMPDQVQLASYSIPNNATIFFKLQPGQTASTPIFSPNGKQIAFYSNLFNAEYPQMFNRDGNINSQICTISLATTKIQCLNNTPNKNPFLIGWNNNNQELYVTDFAGSNGPQIYALSFNSNHSAASLTHSLGYIYPLSISYNNKCNTFGLVYENTSQPPEAYTFTAKTKKLQQISSLQPIEFSQQPLGKVKTIQWQAKDGRQIEGLLIVPTNYSKTKSYPLLVTLHGGPMECWSRRYLGLGAHFEEKIMPLSLAGFLAQGFIILQPNPRGSTGYGLEFRAANYADWGGNDYLDIVTGIDSLIKQKIADEHKLALWGWSYGGYMTAWIIGHEQRFKAAIAGDGIYNLALWAGSSDLPNILYENFGKQFWQQPNFYLSRSPIAYTENILTPLLLLHGAKDSRVIIAQSNELYTALTSQNKPVKMYILPNEGHGPTNPATILDALKKTEDWLNQIFVKS